MTHYHFQSSANLFYCKYATVIVAFHYSVLINHDKDIS